MTNRLIFTLLALFFTLSAATAQKQRVYENSKSMSLGKKPCFTIDVPNVDPKVLGDSWEDYAKQKFGTKLKYDRKSGEWSAKDIQTRATGKDPGNLYATVEKTGGGSALNLWFDYGTEFLSRDTRPNQTEETIKVLEEFEVHAQRDMIAIELAAENKVLKSKENELAKLQRDSVDLVKSIDNYKLKISQAEEKLQINAQNQKVAKQDIDLQRQRTQSVQEKLDKVGN